MPVSFFFSRELETIKKTEKIHGWRKAGRNYSERLAFRDCCAKWWTGDNSLQLIKKITTIKAVICRIGRKYVLSSTQEWHERCIRVTSIARDIAERPPKKLIIRCFVITSTINSRHAGEVEQHVSFIAHISANKSTSMNANSVGSSNGSIGRCCRLSYTVKRFRCFTWPRGRYASFRDASSWPNVRLDRF